MESRGNQGRVFFYVVFALLTIATLALIRNFISVILVALITVVLLRPVYLFFTHRKWTGGRIGVATTLTLVSFLLIIIIPIIFFGWLTYVQLEDFLTELGTIDVDTALPNVIQSIEDFLKQLSPSGEFEIDEEQFIEGLKAVASSILAWLANLAISLGTSLPNLFINGIIFLVLVASLLPAFDDLGKRVEDISPLGENISHLYLHRAKLMILSVVKGVFLLAIFQGLIIGVFYWLGKVPFAAFWTILSMAFAILPVVGISFIVLPMAFVFLITGNTLSAVLVLIGFYLFVNPLDVILRPRLVSKEAYLNFTLMLLALFGGIQLAGVLGMIYGPVIMIMFLTSIDIYTQYFVERDEDPAEVVDENGQEASAPENETGSSPAETEEFSEPIEKSE